jgi:hypothetical protein
MIKLKTLSLIVLGILIFNLIPSSIVLAVDAWYSTLWAFRKQITITGTADGAQTYYPMKLLIGKNTGATGAVIDCGGRCMDSFSDLKFTSSDGITPIDHFTESIVVAGSSLLATVWVEIPSVPISPSTTYIYMYYGNNGATTASNCTATFTTADDFEWGSSGDNVSTSGGGTTWTVASETSGAYIQISTAQASGLSYTRTTRSARLHETTPHPTMTTTKAAATRSYAIRWFQYKDNSSTVQLYHGDGTHLINFYVTSTAVRYWDGSGHPITTITINAWHVFEINDMDFTAGTYDVWIDEGKVGNNIACHHNATATGTVILGNTNGSTSDWYLDNFIIRKWTTNEPTFTSYGAEETCRINASASAGWITGWIYCKGITIGGSDALQTDYPMKLLVGESSGSSSYNIHCQGNCKSDFGDLRFINSSGTQLDYWIESTTGVTPNQTATVWVEVDSIAAAPTLTILYMLYGNASASTTSSGPNTFTFFDHFDVDLGKWQGDTAAVGLAGSIATITGTAAAYKKIYTLSAYSGDIVMRAGAMPTANNYAYVGMFNTAITSGLYCYWASTAPNYYWNSYAASVSSSMGNKAFSTAAYHVYEFRRITTGQDISRAFYDDVEVITGPTTNVPTVDLYPMLMTYGNGSTNKYDWVLIRKYTLNEPMWDYFGLQTIKQRSFGNIVN